MKIAYEKVKGETQHAKSGAKAFIGLTTVYISESVAYQMLKEHIKNDLSNLVRYYKNWDYFPAGAQLALMDIIYNRGFGGLQKMKPMNDALKQLDFDLAGKHSGRGIGAERDKRTKERFEDAARAHHKRLGLQ